MWDLRLGRLALSRSCRRSAPATLSLATFISPGRKAGIAPSECLTISYNVTECCCQRSGVEMSQRREPTAWLRFIFSCVAGRSTFPNTFSIAVQFAQWIIWSFEVAWRLSTGHRTLMSRLGRVGFVAPREPTLFKYIRLPWNLALRNKKVTPCLCTFRVASSLEKRVCRVGVLAICESLSWRECRRVLVHESSSHAWTQGRCLGPIRT